MDSLVLTAFMRKHKISDCARGLMKLTDHINAMAPQLPSGFGNDVHNTRYLRRAVMRYDWAKQPIASVTTARYTFTQSITALQESLQLNKDLSPTFASNINYGQYLHNPKDVGYPNGPSARNSNSRAKMRRQSTYPRGVRFRSPFNRFNRYR